MSPVATDGLRIRVAGAQPLSVWLPSDWEVDQEQRLFEFVALGPDEVPYRANLSIHHVSVEPDLSLEAIADATAANQAKTLETFVEYDRRASTLAGSTSIHREYGWVQGGTGLVLYQLEDLALPESMPGRLLEVHTTSFAPSYFRYGALFRRMIDSIQAELTA
jgi:hypothetical protein